MSSSREKLRAMSKKNLAEQKQVENQPTLVSDMINQLNESKPGHTPLESNTKSQISEKKEQHETPKVPAQVELEAPNKTDSPKEETESNKMSASQKTKEIKKKPSEHKENITSVLQNNDKYNGKEVTITLLLSEEVEEYLTFKALELRVPVKKLFRELMINEIENGTLIEDDLTKAYRKVQHNTVKKSIPVNEDLKEAIKETAIKYHMRYTPFMTYVIDKARKRDLEAK